MSKPLASLDPVSEGAETLSPLLVLHSICDQIGGQPAMVVQVLSEVGWSKEKAARRLRTTKKVVEVNLFRFRIKAQAAAAAGLLDIERVMFEAIFPRPGK